MATVTGQSEIDSTGLPIPAGLPQTLAYNADGTLNTITLTSGSSSWVQTYGYTNGQVTSISAWVKQ